MGRLRHEAGQTVVLFAVLLPLLLGLGAIAVDVGYWYVVKKTAQDAADAAALAAARELPDCEAARDKGEEYGWANLPDATDVDVNPSGGCGSSIPGAIQPEPANQVEVVVTHDTGTFFGRALGVAEPTITARATAERTAADDNLAIFAYSDDCSLDAPALEFAASDVFLNGRVQTNGRFRISSGPFWAHEGTIYRDGCPSSVETGIQVQFGEARPPPWGTACGGQPCREPNDVFSLQAWPMWFTPAQLGWPNCTYEAATIEITGAEVRLMPQGQVIPHNGVIPSGTYCATGSFLLDGDNLRGRLTVLAPQIAVDGDGLDLESFAQNVLFFAVPNVDQVANDGPPETAVLECVPDSGSDLTLTGSGTTWTGIVFNPCGRVVAELDATIEGAVLADRVLVTGNGFEMIGKGDFQYSTALVE